MALTSSVAQTTDALSLPSLQASTFTTYDIEQGLPVSCIEETFIDRKGRMWVNPCRILDIHRKQSFFQFDGNKSYTIAIPNPEESSTDQAWFIQDITPSGFLFGTNLERTHTFFYDPDLHKSQVFSFEKEERIINLLGYEKNGVIAITQHPNKYSIYRVTQTRKELLQSIELNLSVEEEINFNTPAVLEGDLLFFLHQNNGFIQYNLDSNTLDNYKWEDLLNEKVDPYSNLYLTKVGKGKITFFFSKLKSCFDFDIQTKKLSPNLAINQYLKSLPKIKDDQTEIYSFKDKSGNTIIRFTWWPLDGIYAKESYWLLDSLGKFYDYQNIINEVTETSRYGIAFSDDRPIQANYINSENFKKKAIITTDGGLHSTEIKADLALEVFVKGWPSRVITEWSPGNITVNSDNGYLQLADLNQKNERLIGNNLEELTFGDNISQSPFSKIIYQGNEKIWFASGKYLVSYHKKQKIFTTFPTNQEFDKFAFLNEKEVILADFIQNQVFIYNLDQNQLQPYSIAGTPLNIGGRANEIMLSQDSIIWIASLNGLWKIEQPSGKVFHLNEKNGLSNNQVICIYENNDGKIWIGMLNGGLQIYDPESGALQLINESNGLSNNSVVGILEDEDGDKWVSTFSGITVLSNEGEILFKVQEKDGISHQEFNRFSYHKLEDGRLIFGAVSGINVLEPQKIKAVLTQKDSIQLYFTEIRFFDKKLSKDTLKRGQFETIQQIILPATHRYLSLDFSLSDYTHAQNSSFAYQLIKQEDLNSKNRADSSWISIGNNSFLTLNDLPEGQYSILIRGTDHKGQHINNVLRIPIKVKEFFYKTWWFYMLCTLPLLLGVFIWSRRLVTEKKRLEIEVKKRTHQIQLDKKLIEQQASKLQELDKVKSRFFTNISHEFRTPLTVISGMADQLEDQEKAKSLIKRNSESLLNMINQILDLRKLEVSKLQLDLVQGDIITYLKYITESFSSLADTKGVQLQFSTDPEELIMDYDPEKFLRIVSNLLSNAIKFTPQGGKIDIRASLDTSTTLSLEVKDTGIGISKEQLPYIFDRFYQGSHNQKSNEGAGGTGIGLALTKELIKLMNGQIIVESSQEHSSPDRGTTITIYLPIKRKAEMVKEEVLLSDQIAKSIQSQIANSNGLQPNPIVNGDKTLPNLLIVEDNPDIVQYLITCLQDQFQLDFAKHGQEGIEKAFEVSPDIILSDVMMPVKDGFELCQTLKLDQRTSHIPIVLLTAKADIESRIEGLERGADAYLAKPFNKKELLVSLQKLIEIRQRLQERYRVQEALQPSNDPAIQIEDAFITKVRKAVEQNIDNEKFGPNELAKSLGMSRSSFFAKIKALTDRSPALYIRSIRLHRSKSLLKNTDLNISQIAYEVGFEDPNYFTRCFSQEFGISPKQFRA